ncbi:MAG: hypothetical protein F6K28_37450 [Microcoleus sp. SIO2G3]|nr:hypothetical protein [Microcoleus sp. SIO2G3]
MMIFLSTSILKLAKEIDTFLKIQQERAAQVRQENERRFSPTRITRLDDGKAYPSKTELNAAPFSKH